MDEEAIKCIKEIEKKIKEDNYFLNYYDDIGTCYEFSFILDDVWKKDHAFCLFAERLVRLIAMDVKIPPELISFGKWGARIVMGDWSDRKMAEYIYKIENHPSFKGMCEACKIATNGKTTDFGDNLTSHKEEILTAFETHFSNSEIVKFETFKKIAENWVTEAKEDMSDDEFKKFIENVNTDLSWAKISKNGKVSRKNPLEGLG